MENINVPGAFAKNLKCPCCQNPWNQGDSLNNTTDTTFIACQPCLSDNKGFKGLDPSNFDPSVPVGENFFLWSNGGWKKNNPIPNEYSSWNTFIVLRDLNLERLKVILDDLLSATTSASSEVTDADIEKVKLFYAAFMNEEIIESNDAAPIFPILDLCGDIVKNPAKTIAALHSQYGVNGFFALGSMPDKANSELTIASLYQSGLGLPDRDYYFDADKKEKRSKYVEYIASLFDLLKDSLTKQSNSSISSPYVSQLKKLDSKTLAEKVLAFETELASHHLTRTACRDPNLTYNKLSFNDVIALSKQHTAEITWQHYLTYGIHPHVAFDWKDYFNLIGKSPVDLGDIINLQAKHYLVHLPKILNENADILPYYSIFHVLNSYAPHLSSRWVNAHFLFHEKELKGTSDLLVRWKRGLQALESALGEALGKLYVQRHFPTEYKQKALDVVYSVRDALQQRLTEIPWMSAETKTEAFLKMNKFKVKIGYPDHWKDYSHLNIYKDQHVANVIASRSFEFQVDLRRMNAPTDKARWFMTPQTVNAYFHPSLNEIVFPAAILQPPFFDAEADVAVQFGSLGAVVGHEMTHGYDDQVRFIIVSSMKETSDSRQSFYREESMIVMET